MSWGRQYQRICLNAGLLATAIAKQRTAEVECLIALPIDRKANRRRASVDIWHDGDGNCNGRVIFKRSNGKSRGKSDVESAVDASSCIQRIKTLHGVHCKMPRSEGPISFPNASGDAGCRSVRVRSMIPDVRVYRQCQAEPRRNLLFRHGASSGRCLVAHITDDAVSNLLRSKSNHPVAWSVCI